MQPTVVRHFSSFEETCQKMEEQRRQLEADLKRRNDEWAEQQLQQIVLNYSKQFGFPEDQKEV